MKHLWLKLRSVFVLLFSLLCHSKDMCGEVHSEPTVPNKASQLSACYVCASVAVPYIYRKRSGSFILPLNFLNTKDPTPACLSVCGEADHDTHRGNMRGRTEGSSRPIHCPNLRIQRDENTWRSAVREEFPSVGSNDCRCAPGGLLLRTSGPRKLPRASSSIRRALHVSSV